MRFELGAALKQRLIQRIANITVGSLISTLFIAGAGVGIGVVTAPEANAANPTMVSVTKVQNGIAAVKWTDVRSSEPNLTGYSLKYSTNAGGGSTFYLTLGLVNEAQVCVSQSGNYDYQIAKITTGGIIGTYSAVIAKNVSTNASCSGTAYAFTINFFANGGSGSMESVTGTSSGYVTPASNFIPPANQSFKNWNTASGGGGTTYSPGSVIPVTSANQVVNLYAQYNTSYSISSASASPAASSVATGYTAASTQTTITLNRSGSSGSNPVETITVDAGTWTLVAGSGITLSATSVSSGSPITATLTAASGTFTLQLNTGSNAGSYTSTLTNATSDPLNYVVTVSASLPAPNITLSTGTVTGTYNSAISEPVYIVNNYGGNIASFSISPALPTGLSLDTTTGLLSGTPTQIVSRTETLTATNATGSSSVAFTLTVNKANQTVNWNPTTTIYTNQSPLAPSVTATTTGDGTITYSKISNTNSSCSVNSSTGVLTYSGTGDCEIQATASSTTNYNSATKNVTFNISELTTTYSVASATSSVGSSKTVLYEEDSSASQTTITLSRAGDSLPNPTVSISVSGGTWSATQGTGTTISGTSATIISGSPVTVTLTAATGTLTLSRTDTLTVSTETATVNSTTPRTYVVTVTADEPDPPSVSDTSTVDSSFTVTWNRPTKVGSGAISSYAIGISPTRSDGVSSINVPSTGASTESYTVSGLTNGTEYTFTVTATNNGGRTSTTSASSTARGKPSRIPSAPVTPTVTAYTDTATVTWSALSGTDTGGETISYYTIEESSTATSGAWTVIETTTATSIERSGLTGRSNISYRIFATNLRGPGPKSTGSAAVSPGKKNHSLNASSTSTSGTYKATTEIDITVTSSDADFSGASLSSSLTYSVSGDANVCEVSTNGKVKAYSGSGARAGTCVVTVSSSGNASFNGANTTRTFTFDSIAPNDPETSTVTANTSSVSISWNVPTEDGGKSISNYALYYKLATQSDSDYVLYSDTITATSQSISGLLAATDYTFKLKAKNADNKSSSGRVISSRTSNASKAARGLSVTSDTSTINYGQTVVLTKGGTSSGSRWVVNDSNICTVDETGTVTSVGAGSCVVSLVADEDDSNAADSVSYTIEIGAVNPSAPVLSEPVVGEESVTLSWTAPTNRGGASAISGYTVTSTPAGFGCTTTGATSCTITGLDSSVTYSFTITATSNRSKTSNASAVKSAKPNAKSVSTPAPERERAPITGPSPSQEPVRATPKPNEVLPPVRIPGVGALPSATTLPSKGNIVTLKDGKEDLASLTIVRERAQQPGSSTSVAPTTLITKAEIKGDNWGITVQSSATPVSTSQSGTANPGGPTDAAPNSQLTFNKGYSAQTQGSGFAPRTTIAVYLFSDPILIGKIRTDSSGNFKGTIRIPKTIPDGPHTLQLNGATKTFEIRTASLPVVVQTKPVITKKAPTVPAVEKPVTSINEEIKSKKLTFTINFGLNSWWLDSKAYNVLRAAIAKVPVDAKQVTISIVGHSQKTIVDPYPNIGLDRAKAVAKALRSDGFKGRYSVVQSDQAGLTSAEYRRADVTISWVPAS